MVITSVPTEVLTVKLPEYFVWACPSFPNRCIFSVYGMHAGVRILKASCFVKGHNYLVVKFSFFFLF